MLSVVSQPNHQLKPLDLTPLRVLVVAAHPGDIECGASAAAAKWTKEGAEVVYLVATRGELSMPGVEPEDAALIRSGEQSAAAEAVGVRVVDFLDEDDGTVEPSVRLRRAIVADIRKFRPDVVMTMNHREQESDGTINDADHRAVGAATLDAVSAAANQWAFRGVGEPHIVGAVLVVSSPASTHAIDVSGFEDDAVRAFLAHEQHLVSIADHPMADSSWLTSTLRAAGDRLPSSTAALTVERVEYVPGRPCHSSIVKEFVDTEGSLRVMRLPDKPARSKTPTRARNTAPSAPESSRTSRKSKPKPAKTSVSTVGAMKFKVRLEQRGRSIGVEIPDSVMARLDGTQRPSVVAEMNNISFETTIGANNGRRFIAVNAERRKAAGIEIGDVFFLALSTRVSAVQGEVEKAGDVPDVVANTVDAKSAKRNRRRRSSRSPKRDIPR